MVIDGVMLLWFGLMALSVLFVAIGAKLVGSGLDGLL